MEFVIVPVKGLDRSQAAGSVAKIALRHLIKCAG